MIKGVRGGSRDSKECKIVRTRKDETFKKLFEEGVMIKDDEHYIKTKRTRYLTINLDDKKILPSLNMTNLSDKEVKAQLVKDAKDSMLKVSKAK